MLTNGDYTAADERFRVDSAISTKSFELCYGKIGRSSVDPERMIGMLNVD